MVIAAKKAKNKEVIEIVLLSTNKTATVSPIKDKSQYGIADVI
jgi:hypothetical protein